MTDYLYKLPDFLRKYVYDRGWSDFREVQKQAFDVLFESDSHLLLSAGTSSGKTEASMFPVIASLHDEPANGVGALYISPLKALINDQFERVEEMLSNTDIKLTYWHGDASATRKRTLISKPEGILQITPESLQALMINHHGAMKRMFSELRFVIIDEAHAFMNSDRGLQLLCEIETLERMTGCNPRRIGLSATIEDMEPAKTWLKGNSERDVRVVKLPSTVKNDIVISYHKVRPRAETDDDENRRQLKQYYLHLLNETDKYNCLVFVNDKMTAEKVGSSLKRVQQACRLNKPILVHHGSISNEIRRDTEEFLKSTERKCTAITTSTLELGIDIGDLDRVVQLEPPYTCSSFLQRLGRSGRRNGRPVMRVMCSNEDSLRGSTYPNMSMNLLRAIAVVELSVKEHWVEPIIPSTKPFGLLYQQTLAFIKSNMDREIKLSTLRDEVLSQYPFRNITEEEYKFMLFHLIKTGHLENRNEIGIVLGRNGERIAGSFRFYAMFDTAVEIPVIYNGVTIGTVQGADVGDLISLAGRTWKVLFTNDSKIEVEPSDAITTTKWKSGVADIHTRVMAKMKDILESDEEFDYLDDDAAERLDVMRTIARETGMLVPMQKDENQIIIHPWLGTVQFNTLVLTLLSLPCIDKVDAHEPYFISIKTKESVETIRALVNGFEYGKCENKKVFGGRISDIWNLHKFTRMVPNELLERMYLADRVDFDFRI